MDAAQMLAITDPRRVDTTTPYNNSWGEQLYRGEMTQGQRLENEQKKQEVDRANEARAAAQKMLEIQAARRKAGPPPQGGVTPASPLPGDAQYDNDLDVALDKNGLPLPSTKQPLYTKSGRFNAYHQDNIEGVYDDAVKAGVPLQFAEAQRNAMYDAASKADAINRTVYKEQRELINKQQEIDAKKKEVLDSQHAVIADTVADMLIAQNPHGILAALQTEPELMQQLGFNDDGTIDEEEQSNLTSYLMASSPRFQKYQSELRNVTGEGRAQEKHDADMLKSKAEQRKADAEALAAGRSPAWVKNEEEYGKKVGQGEVSNMIKDGYNNIHDLTRLKKLVESDAFNPEDLSVIYNIWVQAQDNPKLFSKLIADASLSPGAKEANALFMKMAPRQRPPGSGSTSNLDLMAFLTGLGANITDKKALSSFVGDNIQQTKIGTEEDVARLKHFKSGKPVTDFDDTPYFDRRSKLIDDAEASGIMPEKKPTLENGKKDHSGLWNE